MVAIKEKFHNSKGSLACRTAQRRVAGIPNRYGFDDEAEGVTKKRTPQPQEKPSTSTPQPQEKPSTSSSQPREPTDHIHTKNKKENTKHEGAGSKVISFETILPSHSPSPLKTDNRISKLCSRANLCNKSDAPTQQSSMTTISQSSQSQPQLAKQDEPTAGNEQSYPKDSNEFDIQPSNDDVNGKGDEKQKEESGQSNGRDSDASESQGRGNGSEKGSNTTVAMSSQPSMKYRTNTVYEITTPESTSTPSYYFVFERSDRHPYRYSAVEKKHLDIIERFSATKYWNHMEARRRSNGDISTFIFDDPNSVQNVRMTTHKETYVCCNTYPLHALDHSGVNVPSNGMGEYNTSDPLDCSEDIPPGTRIAIEVIRDTTKSDDEDVWKLMKPSDSKDAENYFDSDDAENYFVEAVVLRRLDRRNDRALLRICFQNGACAQVSSEKLNSIVRLKLEPVKHVVMLTMQECTGTLYGRLTNREDVELEIERQEGLEDHTEDREMKSNAEGDNKVDRVLNGVLAEEDQKQAHLRSSQELAAPTQGEPSAAESRRSKLPRPLESSIDDLPLASLSHCPETTADTAAPDGFGARNSAATPGVPKKKTGAPSQAAPPLPPLPAASAVSAPPAPVAAKTASAPSQAAEPAQGEPSAADNHCSRSSKRDRTDEVGCAPQDAINEKGDKEVVLSIVESSDEEDNLSPEQNTVAGIDSTTKLNNSGDKEEKNASPEQNTDTGIDPPPNSFNYVDLSSVSDLGDEVLSPPIDDGADLKSSSADKTNDDKACLLYTSDAADE